MINTRSRRLGVGAAVAVATAAAIAVPASSGRAAPATPGLRLLSAVHQVEADRFGNSPHLYVSSAVYVAATKGAFEIDATHKNGKVHLEQVRRSGSKVTNIRHITTPAPVKFGRGLPQFLDIAVTDSTGNTVFTDQSSFCPVGQYDAQRISPNGPDNPTYPEYCGDSLSRKMVWGIDSGWADPEYLQLEASTTQLPDGTYTMTVTIDPAYVKQFGVAPTDRQVTLTLKIVTDNGCSDICAEQRRAATAGASPAQRAAHRNRVTPNANPAHPVGLPDLIALPAHDLGILHNPKTNRDYLGFAATIWNAGPGAFDIEGFRHGTKPTMAARQYLYNGNHSERSMKIGKFEFDTRPGHQHWHLEDVARYDLLDAQQNRVVLSSKQSFCLAPTDPVNLLTAGALWNPDTIGLESSCPTEQSLWLRETLPVGWGDTYVQQKAGQSFNITDLPNGRYLVRVTTNPFGKIHETTRSNNSALLSVALGGTPGARTVTDLGAVH